MLSLAFGGWFECRLATDPDPTDEPRGVSGFTFALAGEPDMDRVLRTQPQGAVGRPFGPKIGVTVRTVMLDGHVVPDHPLVHAPVELLDRPVFEGRNGLAYEDVQEPLVPFHLRVRGAGVLLRREYRSLATGAYVTTSPLGPTMWPDLPKILNLEEGVNSYVKPYKKLLEDSLEYAYSPMRQQQLKLRLAQIEQSGMIALHEAFRARRRKEIETALAKETSPTLRLAYEKRLIEIVRGAQSLAEFTMAGALDFRYVLEGPWFEVEDTEGSLNGTVEATPWIVSFALGAWDTDTLSGFMRGTIEIPFRRATGKRGQGGS